MGEVERGFDRLFKVCACLLVHVFDRLVTVHVFVSETKGTTVLFLVVVHWKAAMPVMLSLSLPLLFLLLVMLP